MVPDDKMPLLLHLFPNPPRAQFLLLFATFFFYAEHDVCVTAVLRDAGGGGVVVVVGSHLLRTHTPLSSRLRLQILHICIALHRLAPLLPSTPPPPPRHHPCLPSHVSTPPSGSSKYFPSLLFEASMGHGTSCTNHAGLPWGGRSEKTGVSQTHGNPICTVFIRGYFSCQDSHHQSAAGSKQRVSGSACCRCRVLAADFNHIPQPHQKRGRDRE